MDIHTIYQNIKEVLQQDGFLAETKLLSTTNVRLLSNKDSTQQRMEGVFVTRKGDPANSSITIFVEVLHISVKVTFLTSYDVLNESLCHEYLSSSGSDFSIFPRNQLGLFFNVHLPHFIRGSLESYLPTRSKSKKVTISYAYSINKSLLDQDEKPLLLLVHDFIDYSFEFLKLHFEKRQRLIDHFITYFEHRPHHEPFDDETNPDGITSSL